MEKKQEIETALYISEDKRCISVEFNPFANLEVIERNTDLVYRHIDELQVNGRDLILNVDYLNVNGSLPVVYAACQSKVNKENSSLYIKGISRQKERKLRKLSMGNFDVIYDKKHRKKSMPYIVAGAALYGVLSVYALYHLRNQNNSTESPSYTAPSDLPPIAKTKRQIRSPESASNLIEVTPDNIDAVLEGTYVIDVWAKWCGPCRRYAKPFLETAQKYSGRGIEFAKMDLDTNKGNIDQLIRQGVLSAPIRSIPCTLVIEDGKETTRFIGSNHKKLQEIVESLIDPVF
jgi:thiol-disulfide isomerase/thioredoxin